MVDHPRAALRRARRRAVSGLGILLVVAGLAILAVTYSLIPARVYQFWPLLIVLVGVVGLLRRPGWLEELDLVLPGVANAASRPRRMFSFFLIGLGLFLLVLSLHLVPDRVVGPAILIGLGLLLVWRRSR